MRAQQTVSEMVVEVLARQADELASRTGRPFRVAFEEVKRTEAGGRLCELAEGAHRHEEARHWQANLLFERVGERAGRLVGRPGGGPRLSPSLPGSDLAHVEGAEMVGAPRVLIAIEPRMYAEVLAFSLGRHRPNTEISLLGPSEELEEAVLRLRPHLVVANRVPEAAREGPYHFFWVEVDEVRGGEGAKCLGARISADGYSESVQDVGTEHVLAALDRASEAASGSDLVWEEGVPLWQQYG